MQSKASELSEECIQHTLDRMEVQTLALIMQAEHRGYTSQFKVIQQAGHKSRRILHMSAV